MKGKVPLKYWQEDCWPEVEDLFMKLHIDQDKGQDLFLAFCAMDTDAGGTVDIEECFAYLGGVRTRFTERIWHHDAKLNEEGEFQEGLSFKEFAIVCWNYCTMQPHQFARMIFEIFDVEKTDLLEKPDVETIYRFMYDCEDFDEYYVNKVPFEKDKDGNETIEKVKFCEFLSKNKHIIQPALDYQRRLRSKMGGQMLWDNLAGFRRRMFFVHDEQSASTSEALLNIINSEDPNRRARKQAAERVLAEKKAAMEAKANAAMEELRAIERAREEEERRKELSAEDRFMKVYWTALDNMRAQFEDEEFLIDDAWRRREKRLELFDLLDTYEKASDEYWAKTDMEDFALMTGTDDDHEARYKEFLKTADGKVTFNYTAIKHALESKDADFEKKEAATKKKDNLRLAVQDALIEREKKVEKVLMNRALIAAGALKSKTKAAQLRPVDFIEENKLMKQICSKSEIEKAELQARTTVWNELKKSTLSKAETFINDRKKERAQDLKRVEFEIATTYGSRITRWEHLYDRANEKYVYMNVDTMEIIHVKTAICEQCDSLFEQTEKLCKKCDSRRSTKNQLLYRPLGFKDIRID